MTESCNSSCSQSGCNDNGTYAELVSAQEKLLAELTDTETNLDNFSSTLLAYCQTEQLNLTNIDTKMQTVVDVNNECCSMVNSRLEALIEVLEGIDDCDTYCNLAGDIECEI